jgi:hypothetical protein
MNIYSFHKLTRPYYEGGLTIDCRPRGKFLVEVRRTDGTIRRPFGDHLIENTFLNQWRDGQLGGTGNSGTSNTNSNVGWGFGSATDSNTWLDLFYTRASIAVGSGSTAASAADTALGNAIRHDSTAFTAGNAVTWSQSTGDVVYTIKEQFPVETATVTYREAGIRIATGGTNSERINSLDINSNRLINRVVFPANVTLVSGEVLILTLAVTVPTLAKTGGKTITISAQNGMNISGALRITGTEAAIVGGTVTGGGVVNRNTNLIMLWSPHQTLRGLLGTQTAFDTVNANPSWGSTNQVIGAWGSYTNGQYFRDATFTWSSGTPATNTDFRSILFRPSGTTSSYGGYHLLLDNQQTKASAGALALSLRFSL